LKAAQYLLAELNLILLVKLAHESSVQFREIPILWRNKFNFGRLSRASLFICSLFEPNLWTGRVIFSSAYIVNVDRCILAFEID